jgi:hypothetical protein
MWPPRAPLVRRTTPECFQSPSRTFCKLLRLVPFRAVIPPGQRHAPSLLHVVPTLNAAHSIHHFVKLNTMTCSYLSIKITRLTCVIQNDHNVGLVATTGLDSLFPKMARASDQILQSHEKTHISPAIFLPFFYPMRFHANELVPEPREGGED